MPERKHVAVLGGGIMGAGIAGFFADRGHEVSIFDLTLDLARSALDKLTDPKAKVPLILSPRSVKRIKPYALASMKEVLPKADLVIEAVPEVMDIKRKSFIEVDKHRRQGSVVATNTSGLSLAKMCEGFSQDFQENFIGIHFFNPVRYMALVEIIPGPVTRKDVVADTMELFVDAGKKPILGKDTPNFVANRVGIYSLMWTLALAKKYGLSIEDVDLITGEALGRPKTATFRLGDMVGIDTLFHAARNSFENCPNDDDRGLFDPPGYITKMLEMKLLGDKTGKGFYQKVKADKGKGGDDEEGGGAKKAGKPDLLVLDLETLEYRPKKDAKANCVRVAKTYSQPADRIRAMVMYDENDPVCRFARELVLGTAAYALKRVGEVADDIETVDNAIKWGFGHEVGPIEALDHIGLHRSIRMMEELSITVPEKLRELARTTGRAYPAERPVPPRQISLSHLRNQGRLVRENLNARLIDLGDGILCCELDAKMVPTMNPVDDYMISMMMQAHEEIRAGRFQALVVANQAANFCAGAQLQLVLELSKRKKFEEIRQVARGLQMANLGNLHAPFPVVVAPHGMTLGGGLEIAMGGQTRVAAAETYAGLVEVGVGLVPAGGGCLMLLRNLVNKMAKANPGPMPPVMAAFDLIGFGKVSTSAFDAQDKGFLAKDDVISFSKDEQVRVAKETALKMLASHKPVPKMELVLPGPGGYLAMADSIDGFVRQGKITPYSARIAKAQARILTGGPTAGPASPVSEDTILELEREEFVSLCGEKMTQERMAYMLKNGKPLIN